MKLKTLLLTAVIGAAPTALLADGNTIGKNEGQKTEAGQYVSDSALTAKVKTALIAEQNLKALDINVETQNGTVQLAGFVTSSAQKDQAEDVAKRVKGVKDVKNDLRLKTDTQG